MGKHLKLAELVPQKLDHLLLDKWGICQIRLGCLMLYQYPQGDWLDWHFLSQFYMKNYKKPHSVPGARSKVPEWSKPTLTIIAPLPCGTFWMDNRSLGWVPSHGTIPWHHVGHETKINSSGPLYYLPKLVQTNDGTNSRLALQLSQETCSSCLGRWVF